PGEGGVDVGGGQAPVDQPAAGVRPVRLVAHQREEAAAGQGHAVRVGEACELDQRVVEEDVLLIEDNLMGEQRVQPGEGEVARYRDQVADQLREDRGRHADGVGRVADEVEV
ncbi:MAG: hypothetical protein ACK559_22485, partial [bacterium]